MSYAVVIPAYNAERTIVETLDSILAQTCQPSEIVVVDDGSTDSTVEIAKAHRAATRVISQTNTGCGGATTYAISLTSAPVIAALDADDIWLPQKMEQQLEHLAALGPSAISFTKSRQFHHDDNDRKKGVERDAIIRSTMVLHRPTFEKVGPIIDPPGGAGDMVDWLARARVAGFTLNILPEVLMLRRIIPGSMTYSAEDESHRGYLSVARAAIMRRRQAEQK
ncbi:glycosyltransferase family A protein [Yoonia sp. I 8.24]|uniref:glycosyltransferase family 2 protein n=1 Tax=Yoonia sp. I 8.24 TaxID=1537229 RepID=UPI001EDFFF43|nr:glycosyltransferase family A protein [Yoonia sp. I 8.24]MCG3267387.1 glycosyltransferase family 2 protein [Yoonia sp. I 8.24]